MKQCIFVVLFTLTYLIVPAQKKLRILTYNIHHGYDAKERPELASVASIIKHYSADIIGLQEVDSVCDRSQHIDQPSFLEKKTGLKAAFVRHFPFQGGSYGLCLLSRFPIMNVQNVRLPILHNEISSVALLTADIRLPDRELIKVLVVHFDYRDSTSRINQAHFIVNYCKKIQEPILLMGDFNAAPPTEEINIIEGYFSDASQKETYLTYPDDAPKEKIDFIFFTPRTNWKVEKTLVPDVHASDHLPLLSILKYNLKKRK